MKIERAKTLICAHCHKELDEKETARVQAITSNDSRQYCTGCLPIANIQKAWRPLTSGSVQAIYHLDEKGNVTSRGFGNKS
jgi:hypothetical protein